MSDLVFDTLERRATAKWFRWDRPFPSPTLFPWVKLARYLGSSARHMDPWSHGRKPSSRQHRAAPADRPRYLRLGMSIEIDQIVVTAGALEALNLALQTVARPGDT